MNRQETPMGHMETPNDKKGEQLMTNSVSSGPAVYTAYIYTIAGGKIIMMTRKPNQHGAAETLMSLKDIADDRWAQEALKIRNKVEYAGARLPATDTEHEAYARANGITSGRPIRNPAAGPRDPQLPA